MARVVIRCRFTGHFLLTGIEAAVPGEVMGGRMFCPYCAAEHAWDCTDARLDLPRPHQPVARQAG
jgi:hypothetical protein